MKDDPGNTHHVAIEADVSDLLARIEDMQARVDGLRESIRSAREELQRLDAAAAVRGILPGVSPSR